MYMNGLVSRGVDVQVGPDDFPYQKVLKNPTDPLKINTTGTPPRSKSNVAGEIPVIPAEES